MRNATFPIVLAPLLLAACDAEEAQASGREPTHVPAVERAVAVLRGIGDAKASGVLRFERRGDAVAVTGEISGLSPGKHGLHIHTYGDLTAAETGKSAGGHFAPRGMPHGRPSDEQRHVGDLGNIEADDSGVAKVDLVDRAIALNGAHSIIGRAIVVHAGEDRFTQPSGDAGDRVAVGVIGIAGSDGG